MNVDEKEQLIVLVDKRVGSPIFSDVEVAFLLMKLDAVLYGIYMKLLFLEQIEILNNTAQKQLAEILNISYPSFIQYRDALLKLDLLHVERKGRLDVIQFNQITRLTKEDLKTPHNVRDTESILKWIEKGAKKIQLITPDFLANQELEQAQIKFDGIVVEKAKEIVQKKAKAKKAEEEKFPKEDYAIVLNAYKRYKGVGLFGPEQYRAQHAVKQMFLAKRSVKQIVDCMKFFASVVDTEGYSWVRSWTLETVMKKMPEFVAGKLKAPEIGDDLPDL